MKRTGKMLGILLICAVMLVNMGLPASALSIHSAWAEDELNEAAELGLVSADLDWDYRQDITRQEFAGLMVSLYKILHGSVAYEYATPFTDVDDVNISTAYSLGIVSGMGNGTFAPEREITREQMAVMLHNLLSGLFYEEASADTALSGFSDAGQISSWAYDAAAFITANGIIQGYSGGFHPQEKASREVAVVVSKRVAESYLEKFGQPMKVTLNGYDYALNGRPVWDGENLWLPGSEILSLLHASNIDDSKDYICAWYLDADNNSFSLNFSVGNNLFSPNTMDDVWIETETVPYSINGKIYITEAMAEYIFGDFIQFDSASNTVALTIGGKDISSMQERNSNLFFPLGLKDKSKLDDTRVNCMASACAAVPADNWYSWIDRRKNDGFTRTIFTLNAIDGPDIDYNYAYIEKEIPDDYVDLFRYLKDKGIKTKCYLSYWNLEYRENGGILNKNRLSTEKDIQNYIEYVKMVVTRLKGLVDGYELWNEPDANYDYYQRITPEDYISVARRVIPVIREIDPDARIILVGTSDYYFKDVQAYTNQILHSDIIALADEISLHPNNNDASPAYHSDYYYRYDAMWDDVKATAEANGFKGGYTADGLDFNSTYSVQALQPSSVYHPYEPEVAAKYIGRMIAVNRGMDITVGTSGTDSTGRPIEGAVIRNMAYLLEGLEAEDFTVQTESESALVRYYTFTGGDGSSYLAIWNDIAAAVDCMPIECDITLSGLSAAHVTALDPYNTLEQELTFENTDDGLTISGLMLPDYPVIIRIQ